MRDEFKSVAGGSTWLKIKTKGWMPRGNKSLYRPRQTKASSLLVTKELTLRGVIFISKI